jgi:hypothetical protein
MHIVLGTDSKLVTVEPGRATGIERLHLRSNESGISGFTL